MENFLESYTTNSGETFNISVCNIPELRSDRLSDGLFFRVESAKNPKTSWGCVIRISWVTKKEWNIKTGELRSALTELGLLRIRYALEIGNTTDFDFTFCDHNTRETLENTIAAEGDDLERVKSGVGGEQRV